MKILCISDQYEDSEHSSIEGIFGSHLRALCEVTVVYFSRKSSSAHRDGDRVVVPYALKQGGLQAALATVVPLEGFDVVVVRNFFPVLRQMLAGRERYGYRVGFWNSFPHTYRRVFEAEQTGRSVLRKRIEYKVKSFLEQRLIRRCDFLIAMSLEFRKVFFPEVTVPFLPLPMGVSFDGIPEAAPSRDGAFRMIYTGSVDNLRRTGEVVNAIAAVAGDFVLDIYTASDNEVTRRIARLGDSRITVHPPLPRQELLHRMAGYHLGIGLYPENPLYTTCSPTKTVEYYGVGIPALVNPLPDYQELFDHQSAIFCDFTEESIARAVAGALEVEREALQRMGAVGRAKIVAERDYRVLSHRVHQFLRSVI